MRPRRASGNEDGFVVRSVVAVLITVAVLAVLVYDGASIASNYFSLGSQTDDAVGKVAEVIQGDRSSQPPSSCYTNGRPRRFLSNVPWCAEALQEAKAHNAHLVRAFIDTTGVVHLTMRRTAHTLVLGHFGPTEKWATATVESRTVTQ